MSKVASHAPTTSHATSKPATADKTKPTTKPDEKVSGSDVTGGSTSTSSNGAIDSSLSGLSDHELLQQIAANSKNSNDQSNFQSYIDSLVKHNSAIGGLSSGGGSDS